MTSPHPEGEGHNVAARVESKWALLSIAIIVLLAGMAAFAGIYHSTMPQARVETADPTTLHIAGEFIESNLGSAVEPDGSITIRMIGQQYSFTPQCLLVPTNTPITLRATSSDVIHGLLIRGTNINTMLIPGYISVLSVRFDKSGEHLMPCHEFCGVGHEGMCAKVRVVEKADFLNKTRDRRRLSCVN